MGECFVLSAISPPHFCPSEKISVVVAYFYG